MKRTTNDQTKQNELKKTSASTEEIRQLFELYLFVKSGYD